MFLQVIVAAGILVAMVVVVAADLIGRWLWPSLPGTDYLSLDFIVMAFQAGMPAKAAWLAGTALVVGPLLGASVPARALDGWDRWMGGILAGAVVPVGCVMYAAKRNALTAPLIAACACATVAVFVATWLATRTPRRAPYDEFR